MKHRTFIVAAASLAAHAAFAAQETPVGLWKNIDDQTGKPRALIRISESKRELKGVVEKVFNEAGAEAGPICGECEGALKDKPVVGLTILSGMKNEGGQYTAGQILDPANGKTYRSAIEVIDAGRKLKVQGYIGVPMFGRTQVWVRQE